MREVLDFTANGHGLGQGKIIRNLRQSLYLLTLLSFGVLAGTGFVPLLLGREALSRYFLLVHAAGAPVFAVCLSMLAFLSAHDYRFTESDRRRLRRFFPLKAAGNFVDFERPSFGQKICFWLTMLLALPVVLSVTFRMFPVFGTDAQKVLVGIHRYSALFFSLAAIGHTYLNILSQAKGARTR